MCYLSLSPSLYAASFCVLLQYSEKGGVGVFLGVSPKPINHTKPMLMYTLYSSYLYYYYYYYIFIVIIMMFDCLMNPRHVV